MKQQLKNMVSALGAHLYTEGSLPTGVSWLHDIRRSGALAEQPLCFDVGANVGQTVAEIRRVLPGARIHAFEPFAATFEQLRTATADHPGVSPVALALGAEPDTLQLRPHPRSELSSLLPRTDCESSDARLETIRVETIDRYCTSLGIDAIDVLKTDTEGYDLQVLHGARTMLEAHRIAFVYAEVTFLACNAQNTAFVPVFEWLTARGYCFLGLYETYSMHRFEEPNVFCNALFVSRTARRRMLGAAS